MLGGALRFPIRPGSPGTLFRSHVVGGFGWLGILGFLPLFLGFRGWIPVVDGSLDLFLRNPISQYLTLQLSGTIWFNLSQAVRAFTQAFVLSWH